jgi:hypothetical protein
MVGSWTPILIYVGFLCLLIDMFTSTKYKNLENPHPLQCQWFGVDFLTLEDGTDTLSRNVSKGLPLNPALYPRRAHLISITAEA